MTPEFAAFLQVILETLTLLALIVGLLGLIVPVFPGLVIMWLGTGIYALIQNAAGNMTGWKWTLFGAITILMITGSVVDNIIIARKMRDKYVPWSSILFAFAAGVIASIFFTPLIGLLDALGLGLVTNEVNLKYQASKVGSLIFYFFTSCAALRVISLNLSLAGPSPG